MGAKLFPGQVPACHGGSGGKRTISTMQGHLLVTLLLSVFIALLGIGIIVPVMPVFAASLGAGGLALGLIIAAFSITRGIFQPIVGSLSDRWGRKGSGLRPAGLCLGGPCHAGGHLGD